MKKIIITGGFGFLGEQIVKALSGKFNVFAFSKRNGLNLLNYDNSLALFKKERPDIVIHCAARVGGLAYNKIYPVEIFEENVLIGINVIKACHDAGINTFINIMPNCTYPGHLHEYEESKWWDGAMHESVLTYGLPRKMVWGACFAYCEKNPAFKPVHLILPNLYGPGDHFDPVKSHALGALIAKIVKAKKENLKTVEVWGSGKVVREWLYVEDAAEAVIRTIDNLSLFEPNEIMNIGTGFGISIIDLAIRIKDIVGWNGDFVLQHNKPDGAAKKIIIANKMKQKLGWRPAIDLEQGVRKTVKWYEEQVFLS